MEVKYRYSRDSHVIQAAWLHTSKYWSILRSLRLDLWKSNWKEQYKYMHTQIPLIRAPWDRALAVSPSCPYLRTMIPVLTIVFSHSYPSKLSYWRRVRRISQTEKSAFVQGHQGNCAYDWHFMNEHVRVCTCILIGCRISPILLSGRERCP